MIKVNCPKCNAEVEINLSKAIDELGEVYECTNCKFHFRFVDK